MGKPSTPLSFTEQVAVLQSALVTDDVVPEGIDPKWFAELVNRAVFLDLPDDELAAYLQGTNHSFQRVDETRGSPVLREKEFSAADVDSYRAQRQRVFSQLVHVKAVRAPVAWKYTRGLCKLEEKLGLCFPADLRLMGLMIGWPFDKSQNPMLTIRTTTFSKCATALVSSHDRADIHMKWRRCDGFYTLGAELQGGNFGGWYLVGMNGLCRDSIVRLGTEYNEMTGELKDADRVQTCKDSFSTFLLRLLE